MALKFLNKKGWHTGSLRNIENVWKAEQKRDAEEKKLEELRKQIQEERERTEFRRLQEQAGLVPKQERLDFLYDSGLSVGRPANSEGFKELEAFPKTDATAPSSSASAQKASAPGALFEDKPHSANDAWRKLHSDPLLMIRQREQEGLARIKNNPVQMAIIRKSFNPKKDKEKKHDKEDRHKKSRSSSKHHKHSSSRPRIDSEDDIAERPRRKRDKYIDTDHEEDASEREKRRRKSHKDLKYRDRSPNESSRQKKSKGHNPDADERYYDKTRHERRLTDGQRNSGATHSKVGNGERDRRSVPEPSTTELHCESHPKRRNIAPKLTDEERAAKLREMQLAAELHEDQRWKRLKKAEEEDAREALHNNTAPVGKNFLEAAHKSVYGAEKGGSSTIAESVRRRTHYLQDRSEEGNAFRR